MSCGCVGCGSRDLAGALPRLVLGGLRKGLDRAVGWRDGSGSRAVAFGGRKILRSSVEGPRMLRLIRDPVVKAEAFGLQRTKGESRVHFGVGWAALLPSRGTVHEKGEALPAPAPQRLICHLSSAGKGGRSTAEDDSVADPPLRARERRIVRPTWATAREPGCRRSQPPGRGSFGAQDESKPRQRNPTPTRSRTDAAPPQPEAAPTQPHPDQKPHRRSRRSTRSRTSAAAGQDKTPRLCPTPRLRSPP